MMTEVREQRLPTGVVTFVLTDIVGSTPLWDRAPAAMDEAVTRHDEIIIDAVTQHGGVLLRSRGEGDSTFSVFARATDALRAAQALQSGLGAEPWPAETTIQVRVGVHSGEAVERDGNFLGTAVNRTARLRGLAEGGEVLVSAATAELVTDHLPGEMQLLTVGALQLRGLDRPESAYFLVAPGLPEPRRQPGPQPPTLTERGVTRRESEVLEALGERLTNAEIGARLYVSERTVESHVSSLLRKLQAENRLELGKLAKELAGPTQLVGPSLPAALELLADPPTYVGRRSERDRLHAAWRRASGGQLLVVVLTAEAGMGKSRLAAEVAAELHASGARVLLGSCFEDLQVPYQPFAQALTDDAAGLVPAEVRRRAGRGAQALARLVPSLGATLGVTGDQAAADTLTERAEGFAALHHYLLATAETAPTLFVLEDLHWATAGTRDVLRHLARSGGRAPLLIVVTSRDAAPDLDDELAVYLSDLTQLPAVEHVRLSGLGTADVATLIETIDRSADPQAVHAETGGNPLLARELAAGYAAEGGTSLPSLLTRRYQRLEDPDLDLLDMAATFGTEFDADLLAAATDRPLVEALGSLERTEDAGLVVAEPGRPGRFRFIHALFRTARYEAIPTSRRLGLHQQIASVLRDRSEDPHVVPELARHACIAAPLGEARSALQYARRAGALAERSLALDEAVAHYQRALEVADLLVPPEPGVRLGLRIRLGMALNRMGDARHREVLLSAASDARALGDPHALAEVAWAMSQDGTPTTPGVSDPEFVAVAEDALAELGPAPSSARARTLAALSADLIIGGDPQRACDLAREALTIARSLDEPMLLAQVLLATRTTRWVPRSPDAGQWSADTLLAIGRSTGQTAFTLHGLFERALVSREEGDLPKYGRDVEAFEELLDAVAVPYSYLRVLLAGFRSAHQILAGDLPAAHESIRAMAPIAEGGGFDPGPWQGPGRAMIWHCQGRLPELVPGLEAAGSGFKSFAGPLLVLAYSHADRHREARELLCRLTDELDERYMNSLSLSGWIFLCEAAEMVGEAHAATVLGGRLAPYSGLLAGVFSTVTAPVDLGLAQAALAAGDRERAEAVATRAIAASRARGTPIFLGRELLRLAEARRRSGGSRSEIWPLVDEALGIAERTGAVLIRQEAHRFGLLEEQ